MTPRTELTPEKYLSAKEVERLRRACEDRAAADRAKGRVSGVREWAILDFALQTGLRVHEVTNVRIRDLVFTGKQPLVVVEGGKGRKAKGGKKAVRENTTLPRALVKHLQDFLTFKTTIGEPTADGDHLFCSKRGTPYTTRALQKMFKAACARAGLPKHYSFHATRHTYALALYKKTKDLRLVQKELRHRSIASTTVYADVLPEDRAEAVNGLYDE
jgi:integrase/recombinase XerD